MKSILFSCTKFNDVWVVVRLSLDIVIAKILKSRKLRLKENNKSLCLASPERLIAMS